MWLCCFSHFVSFTRFVCYDSQFMGKIICILLRNELIWFLHHFIVWIVYMCVWVWLHPIFLSFECENSMWYFRLSSNFQSNTHTNDRAPHRYSSYTKFPISINVDFNRKISFTLRRFFKLFVLHLTIAKRQQWKIDRCWWWIILYKYTIRATYFQFFFFIFRTNFECDECIVDFCWYFVGRSVVDIASEHVIHKWMGTQFWRK